MANSFEYKCIKAARKVGENYPYYSPVVARVRFRPDNQNVPTIAINCNLVILYNTSFIKKISNKELEDIILHEILHYINGHHERYRNNPLCDSLPYATHNLAMDLEVNEYILNCTDSFYKAKNFGLPERKSYEEYLDILNRNMPPPLEKILKSPCNSCICGSKNPKNKEKGDDPCDECPHHEYITAFGDINMDGYNEIYETVLYDLIEECAKNWGSEAGSGSMIRKIKKRKYPWEQVFQNIISAKVAEITAGCRYRTFEKVNRRYANFSDIILPQFFDRKTKISTAIIMDISDSMCSNVNKMYEIMKSIIDILDLEIDITVLEVNTDVENIMHGFDLKKESIKSWDGGGTDMSAGLYYIYDNNINTDLIIVMTDSYTPWPKPPILANKTVVLTDNPDEYNGPYPIFPVVF